MYGVTNATVRMGSGGGDVVSAYNSTSDVISKGDKVFMNNRVVATNAKKIINRSTSHYTHYYPVGKDLYFIDTEAKKLYKSIYNEVEKDWSEDFLGEVNVSVQYLNYTHDGFVVGKNNNNMTASSSTNIILHGAINITLNPIYLGYNLCLAYVSSSQAQLKEVNPVTGKFGTVYTEFAIEDGGKISNALLKDNTLLIYAGTSFYFYDITDRNAPVLLNKQTISGNKVCVGATGTSVGDYVFVSLSSSYNIYSTFGALAIYKICDGYRLVDATDLPHDLQNKLGLKAVPIYNVRTKFLTVGTVDGVAAYKFNETAKQFATMGIDVDVSDVSNKHEEEDTPFHLVLTQDLATAEVGYRRASNTYVYPANIIYKNDEATGWTIVAKGGINEQTVTGIATGKVDSNERYEVNTVLPNVVNLTLNFNVEPDVVEFIGGAK